MIEVSCCLPYAGFQFILSILALCRVSRLVAWIPAWHNQKTYYNSNDGHKQQEFAVLVPVGVRGGKGVLDTELADRQVHFLCQLGQCSAGRSDFLHSSRLLFGGC